MTDDKLLTTKELAERWKMSVRTLEGWRNKGKGPKYIKFGNGDAHKVLYCLTDVIEYENRNVRG